MDTRPEKVQFCVKTAASRQEALVCCQKEGTLIIFEDLADDTVGDESQRFGCLMKDQGGLNKVPERNQSSHCHRQTDTFHVQSAWANLQNQLAFGNDAMRLHS